MADNTTNTLWIQQSANRIAVNRAAEAIQQSGRALPCTITAINGSLVTLKFEVNFTTYSRPGKSQINQLPPITIPKAESAWLRAPVQVGDVGLTIPADTFLGGISGQGSGVASLDTDYGNLTTLVWVPVAATSFDAAPDPNKTWVNGPAGSVVSDTLQTVTSVYDHATTAIQHIAGVGTANEVKTIFDGNGNAISHIVSSGGKIGLGALASGLSSARAVPAQADLETLSNNLLGTSIQSLMQIMSTAMGTAGIPNAAAFEAIVTASGWITSNITFPTIPGCSSIVRVST